MEKKIRKFFPISKFTKLVNLLVLETQGSSDVGDVSGFDGLPPECALSG